MKRIPFNSPYLTGNEINYIANAHKNNHLSGDGYFTKKCHSWFLKKMDSQALLTHSCTGALEMSALLLNIKPGDEVIMPSYTFVSTANAFVLRGATPIFVDIREDTLNINENLIEKAITNKTKAIVVVHYAGVSCEMDRIIEISRKYNIRLIEDAAQAILSTYKNKYLGTLGDLAAFSFHETKNIISGEGGAIIVNDKKLINKAEIFREKGTDRSKFLNGLVDKYTWRSEGSSFLPSEIIAAFLWAQLRESEEINLMRLNVWNNYHNLLSDAESEGLLRRPFIPLNCKHNAHMYYVILPKGIDRSKVISYLLKHKIHALSHYEPLHKSIAGKKFGKKIGRLNITEDMANRILRLPLFIKLTLNDQTLIIKKLLNAISIAKK